MKFVMLKDKVVATLSGHAIEFKKGVPTHVPPPAWREVQMAGAVPEEELQDEAPTGRTSPTEPQQRQALIVEAMKGLVKENSPKKFTAAGKPHVSALKDMLGWEPDAKERDEAWNAVLQAED